MRILEGYLSYEWYHTRVLKDHLGNVRVEIDDFGVQAYKNYYPYGIEYESGIWNSEFAYVNKELQSSHGLNWYDFEKRHYDMALGGFTTMDPLCEKYPWISPYAYCAGNPMRYVDPDGQDWVAYYDDKGVRKYKWVDGITSAEDVTENAEAIENGYEYVGRHMTDILTHVGYQMPDETVTSTSTHTVSDRKGNEHEVDMYEIDGNYHGTGVFEFLANATNVEWTHLIFGNTMLNVNGKNYLTTSRKNNTDYGNYVLAEMINVVLAPGMRKVPVQRHAHNHPGGSRDTSINDRENAKNLYQVYPFVELSIFTVNSGYTRYNQYGSFIYDFKY